MPSGAMKVTKPELLESAITLDEAVLSQMYKVVKMLQSGVDKLAD